jgi:precorrin-2 dehydrogenase / sirohydrochlorin ferrochelatase
LRGRKALVVGGGAMALLRTRQLLSAGAGVTLVAPAALPELRELASDGTIVWHQRAFAPEDVSREFFIVVGASDDRAAHAALAREAEAHGLLYNVVDDVEHCNFYTPAVVERGDLKIAISTNGKSPVLARRLREELEAALPPSASSWLEELGELRHRLKTEIPADIDTRKRIIEDVIERTFAHARR